MNAPKSQHLKGMQKPRAISLIAGVLAAVLFGLLFAGSIRRDGQLPASTFAGCYAGFGVAPIELSPSGEIRTRGVTVGHFKVAPPFGDEHGPLIEASGVALVRRGLKVELAPGTNKVDWPVSGAELTVFFPDERRLTKRDAKACV